MKYADISIPGSDGSESLIASICPYVRHCGDETRGAWCIGWRRLLDYLLVFIADGSGEFRVGNGSYEARSGDLFWIPPNTPHHMQGYGPEMALRYVHFDLLYDPVRSHWDFSIPGGMLDMDELHPLLHPPVNHPELKVLAGRMRGHTNGRVGRLMEDLCIEASRAQPLAGLRMSGLLLEIVAEVLRGRMAQEGGWTVHASVLERVAADIARRCDERLSIATLARQHGFSPSHLRGMFAARYGCSPRSYLRQARIRRARGLMMGTNLTLSEIALQVGTVHSFSRAFKAVEGCAPSAYRRAGFPATRVSGRHVTYAH